MTDESKSDTSDSLQDSTSANMGGRFSSGVPSSYASVKTFSIRRKARRFFGVFSFLYPRSTLGRGFLSVGRRSTKCALHTREYVLGVQSTQRPFFFSFRRTHAAHFWLRSLSVGNGISSNGGGQMQQPMPKLMLCVVQNCAFHLLRWYVLLLQPATTQLVFGMSSDLA